MAGTREGGIKAAATNKQRYGLNFYRQIGLKGGKTSRGGGFAMNRDLAVEAGRKGGKASRRGKSLATLEAKRVSGLQEVGDSIIPSPTATHDGNHWWYKCSKCVVRFATEVAYQEHYTGEHL